MASVDQVWRLAALMPRRFRALVIFAAFTGLRWGELVALRVRDVDLDTGVVHVVRKFAELQNGERVPGRPKSDAGLRTVALPSVLVAVVREHLAEFPPSDPEDLIFKRAEGAATRRNNFHRSARWAAQGLRVPRSAPHRRHVGGLVGGEHTGADASDGAREYARCIDLSARHQQAGSGDCGCD